ncbi:tRNA pseudouridine(38-40) synthase TruA [Fulvivirga sp. RKSG066]|uniref:tRNA pseudouridine(38-40) synthase TruA n=1 Tax=Fulvivirga aurantia TaxID=2529383 RepID=UPI0012BD6424|nr:tRNA pseudouridine(38-40) synthase TruA [Fulvivirga aurantia]MTI21950.1 tRNA pseudouridine(38-40) synthase TruA [Fulvivirga aurantia]
MRYFFEIAYDGDSYHGWQRQKNAISVQQVVEEALSTISRENITIMGSGRTDTGVHCEQQFFHADLQTKIDTEKLRFKLNSFLPPTISIQKIARVGDEAHARFDATSRSYEYRITNQKWPFAQGRAYYYTKEIDIKTMNQAAALLLGEHDFQAFSRVKTEVNNFICTITEARWEKDGQYITFHVTANRFLRGMVRALVGTLLEVGTGRLTIDSFKEIIENKDRRQAGSAAPAVGLYLTSVTYPEEIFT